MVVHHSERLAQGSFRPEGIADPTRTDSRRASKGKTTSCRRSTSGCSASSDAGVNNLHGVCKVPRPGKRAVYTCLADPFVLAVNKRYSFSGFQSASLPPAARTRQHRAGNAGIDVEQGDFTCRSRMK